MMSTSKRPEGPLAGLKVLEFAALGPAPMCAMLLSDLGATVLRIERLDKIELGTARPLRFEVLQRGRLPIALDLKSPAGLEAAQALIASADGLIEGFRPGVMERLALGPAECLAINPRLVYGRMTGWGQTGPLAGAAGHDLNYIALTGALDAIGRHGQAPAVPLNLIGDFGGGALYLAFGMLAALHFARSSGAGQVVDASVLDGTLSLMGMHYGSFAAGLWHKERGTNVIDSGAPFYDVYACADGQWVSVASIEHRFFRELLLLLDIDETAFPDRLDRSCWPALRKVLADRFKTRSRADWCAVLEGTDACFAPVLSMAEAAAHPQVQARSALVESDGVLQPAVAPRFSLTPGVIGSHPHTTTREQAKASLTTWFGADHHAALLRDGVLDAVHGTAAVEEEGL
jgi:crotonobetainyl-CoA:carnitine CoA-transferase CaiB-like acyl-CoA transferase